MHRSAKQKEKKSASYLDKIRPMVPLAIIASSLLLGSKMQRNIPDPETKDVTLTLPTYPVVPRRVLGIRSKVEGDAKTLSPTLPATVLPVPATRPDPIPANIKGSPSVHKLGEYLLSPNTERSLIGLENVSFLGWKLNISERNWIRETTWTFDIFLRVEGRAIYHATYKEPIQTSPGLSPRVELSGETEIDLESGKELELICTQRNSEALLLIDGEITYR